jgi:hypothetical protein
LPVTVSLQLPGSTPIGMVTTREFTAGITN